ncbi:MAG: TM2 domain-containing protein [Firmicutes bacterium]|mgnify:FL=1|nr:TM2 domain-containing protein [Bacillota bacterium]
MSTNAINTIIGIRASAALGEAVKEAVNDTPSQGSRESNINIRFERRESIKSKTVTLILCILFGYIGAHRYYVGKIGSGILYTFTIGVFLIGWIADIISIASGSFTDSLGEPIRR